MTKPLLTLGINAAFHDPAACLVADGQVLAAAEDERFTHVKHGKRPVPFAAWELPFHAIDYCLREAGITITDVDHVAYSYDPWQRLGARGGDAAIELPLEPSAHPVPAEWEAAWDPLFLSSIVNAPRHLAGGAPHHLEVRFRGASTDGPYRWHFVSHHLCHAASAFLPSPFEQAAILTLDGRGELATTTYGAGRGPAIEMMGEVHMPHSLGILYEQVTGHLGFLHSSDEYKVMALASFGEPRYVDDFRDIVRVGEDGSFAVCAPRLAERFGPRRLRGGPIEQRHYDVAKSLQVVLEDTVIELANWLHRRTGLNDLCLAGGVALNCVMNARLRDHGPFRRVWVQPAAGDAGTAMGAALVVDSRERGAKTGISRWSMDTAFLGPAFSDGEIEVFLRWSRLSYRRLGDVARDTAALLARDLVIGWFQGRLEFGPRALGARSILASPISPAMQARLNEIKDREDFRPVAPVVIEEEAGEWFANASRSPFMLFVFDVRPDKADRIPAVRHVDGTARIQTIVRAQHPLYYDLLREFQALTGVPVLVNTSFNTRGEPIVCTPRDAVECFWTSPLDALVIGSFLLTKPGVEADHGGR
ncbi:MAG: carbamoyltransferase [Acidobacteria bacterium]|nr:MAG: carbamoyltransferase [Acidobacteriota bacterium]